MKLNDVEIEDTFAEAFPIKVARCMITAVNDRWARIAATEATGFGTSVIMCRGEAGIERVLSREETPDGRPGVSMLICAFSYDDLDHYVLERVTQCILTAPTTTLFNGLSDEDKQLNVGFKAKFFGDGYESEVERYGRKMYVIPTMQGEFLAEESIDAKEGVASGNFFILAENQTSALMAAENAVDVISELDGSITPFTGGIVASGSKPGSAKYSFMKATTNERFCPTLRDKVKDTQVPERVNSIYEIVINGIDEESIKKAMKAGIEAAVKVPGILRISAGNYGGKLGKYRFGLHEIIK